MQELPQLSLLSSKYLQVHSTEEHNVFIKCFAIIRQIWNRNICDVENVVLHYFEKLSGLHY